MTLLQILLSFCYSLVVAENPQNPQTESFLQFLELPNLFENALESREPTQSPATLDHKGNHKGSCCLVISTGLKATSHLSIAVYKLPYRTNSCYPRLGPDLDPEEIPIDDEDELEELDE